MEKKICATCKIREADPALEACWFEPMCEVCDEEIMVKRDMERSDQQDVEDFTSGRFH